MKVQEHNYYSPFHPSYDEKLPKFKENRNCQSPNSSFFAGLDSIEQNNNNILHKDTLQSLVGAAAINTINVKKYPHKVTYQSLQQRKSPEISSSNKPKPSRIKWTREMHQQFVECVNKLGGSEKATPKKILKLMNTIGLTIFHVKSHLQKYRFTKYLPEKPEGNNSESTISTSFTSHEHDPKRNMSIMEALRLQVDVQKNLYAQLEIQKQLQLRIEEQGRLLKMMMNQQTKTNYEADKYADSE